MLILKQVPQWPSDIQGLVIVPHKCFKVSHFCFESRDSIWEYCMDFPIFLIFDTVLGAILLHIPVICKELVTRRTLNCLDLACYILKSSSYNNCNFYSALFFIHIWGKFLDLILLMNKIRVGHWGYVGEVVNFSPVCLFLLFGLFQCFPNINVLFAFKIKVKQTSTGVACLFTSPSYTAGHSQLIQRYT